MIKNIFHKWLEIIDGDSFHDESELGMLIKELNILKNSDKFEELFICLWIYKTSSWLFNEVEADIIVESLLKKMKLNFKSNYLLRWYINPFDENLNKNEVVKELLYYFKSEEEIVDYFKELLNT